MRCGRRQCRRCGGGGGGGGDVVVVMLFVSFDFQVVAATAGGFYCALCLKRVVGVTPQLRIPACLAQSRGTCNTHRSRERFKRM